MKRGAPSHPKMEELADLLEIPRPYAVGLVEMLFHFTDQYAYRGDIGRFTNKQIARRLEWAGDPDALVDALVQCGGPDHSGFLDVHDVHRLVVHDWPDHAPEYTKRKAKGTDAQPGEGWAVNDSEPTPQPTETEEESDTPDNSRKIPEKSDPPYLSLPNQALPNQATTAKPPTPAERARVVWPRLVERAKKHGGRWAATPGKSQLGILVDRLKAGASEESLERAVEGYIRKNGTEPRDGFDPMKHFTATTVFRATKFDANVEGSYLPDPGRKPPGGGSRYRDASEVMAEAKRKQAEVDGTKPDDPEAVGKVIDMALRQAGSP